MKRYLFLLSLFNFLSILCSYAQMPEVEQLFYETYGIIDMTRNEMESIDMLRSGNDANCYNIINRGKNYAPLFIPNETDSIVNVRVNLIFIQKNDGTGNYQENNSEHQALFNDVMLDLNRIVSSLVLPDSDCFVGTNDDMVHDTRIRFVDHRYYVRNSAVWNNNLHTADSRHLHPDLLPWYLDNVDDSLNAVISDTLQAINIYFTEDSVIYHHFWEVQDLTDTSSVWTGYSTAGCSQFPTYSNIQRSSRIHMPCLFSKLWWMKNIVPQLARYNYPSWENQVRYWMVNTISRSLAHELGHSFNLYHPDNEASSSTFYPSQNCSASIMNKEGGASRNFLPPEEIGRMYFHMMTTNLQRFMPTDMYLETKNIASTVTLPRMRMYYSIDVDSNGNITIPCDITFSSQCGIAVQNGGILQITGGYLHATNNSWEGIVVNQGGKLILSNVNIDDYNIIVHSGGSVVIRNDVSINGNHYIKVEAGGFLCVDEDATINLVNSRSHIMVSPNAILGCPSCADNCIINLNEIVNSGAGYIVTYEISNYIQDTIISTNHLIIGDSINAGYDVTTTKPYGEVVVMPGACLLIDAEHTTLAKEFEVKLGGQLQIY